ncbi:hypothetical protein P152DRAFT_414219 [Eremomyces bilateralis CBS 781.70]|uniref:Uncharacterized protein n=1 Tax=Eremomyces bilateralis CBS 781.70 TaxID=1392243 RepID=A0A6G1G7E2_9PEZI|nr:uncharacterized protein P152DRAFT_414219 [Eremomyces bilateralis CBS 781.70]KAF1813810.1 hypothetical protein P152DRAFT_414219 [Eremomyces bilateralis CBS 781.70]
MAMRPAANVLQAYNPQEWARGSGGGSGRYVPHRGSSSASASGRRRTSEVTGMEASLPSPPPPYSPAGSSNRPISSVFPASSYSSSSRNSTVVSPPEPNRSSLHMVARNSPSSTSGPAFPPPPGTTPRDRSTSRNRDKHKFSLSALTSRNRKEDAQPSLGAIDALRQHTTDAVSRTSGPSATPLPYQHPDDVPFDAHPPAARRAASTGCIPAHGTDTRQRGTDSPSNVSVSSAWGPGMPLPPPPPGPPPSTSRSMSMDRITEYSTRDVIRLKTPAPRRPPKIVSTLDPIPPTPAGWVDGQSETPGSGAAGFGEQGQTPRSEFDHSPQTEIHVGGDPGPSSRSGSLNRTGATRGIRERRSESRAAKERSRDAESPISNNPWAADMEGSTSAAVSSNMPADLVLTQPSSFSLSRRRNVKLPSPKLGRTYMPEGPRRSSVGQDSKPDESSGPALPPKEPHGSRPGLAALVMPHSGSRPVSHILHSPNDENLNMDPLIPSGLNSTNSTISPRNVDESDFIRSALNRHKEFIRRESLAKTDRDRIQLFADFIVTESRLRRDRYATAFDGMAGEVLDLTRDLWRSYGKAMPTPTATPHAAESANKPQSTVTESSVDTFAGSMTSPGMSSANATPLTDGESPGSLPSSGGVRDSRFWGEYHPSLSPIPSMPAQSNGPDEEDSRGRTASRWWESSSSQGPAGPRIERSKRESKYMGVPREAREELQWGSAVEPSSEASLQAGPPAVAMANKQPVAEYGPNEYPPEKVGWHETLPLAGASNSNQTYWSHSAPATPDPHKLDVSRLVTLPPPYPRHHPAVNNNHPDLAPIRTIYRTLADMDDIHQVEEKFQLERAQVREQRNHDALERRKSLRRNIETQLASQIMTYSDAAGAEANFESTEGQVVRDAAKEDFAAHQNAVMKPLEALLKERITKAAASIEHLRSGLFNDAQSRSPNQPQEEGDERPELLEKLTLLKWLFEAREALHRELFMLEGQHNELYKPVVVTPYVLAQNNEKVREVEHFFRQDAADRKVAFEKASVKRLEEFMAVVEENVTRGVEVQLSAFWDIAPGLLAIVQKVPSTQEGLRGFEVLVPPQEYAENEAYDHHPLQYLYTVLLHAEKSAYQFIESQTNLLCLLHEVKTAVMLAESKLVETARVMEGERKEEVEQEMSMIRKAEEGTLTVDLKEKVDVVEGQWREALGARLRECRGRVERYLGETGGWEDGLRD